LEWKALPDIWADAPGRRPEAERRAAGCASFSEDCAFCTMRCATSLNKLQCVMKGNSSVEETAVSCLGQVRSGAVYR
jgi:hypothetical protein